jgi:hypothetical protein
MIIIALEGFSDGLFVTAEPLSRAAAASQVIIAGVEAALSTIEYFVLTNPGFNDFYATFEKLNGLDEGAELFPCVVTTEASTQAWYLAR